MKTLKGRTAVITGAGSGFGLEASRIAAREEADGNLQQRRDGSAGMRQNHVRGERDHAPK